MGDPPTSPWTTVSIQKLNQDIDNVLSFETAEKAPTEQARAPHTLSFNQCISFWHSMRNVEHSTMFTESLLWRMAELEKITRQHLEKLKNSKKKARQNSAILTSPGSGYGRRTVSATPSPPPAVSSPKAINTWQRSVMATKAMKAFNLDLEPPRPSCTEDFVQYAVMSSLFFLILHLEVDTGDTSIAAAMLEIKNIMDTRLSAGWMSLAMHAIQRFCSWGSSSTGGAHDKFQVPENELSDLAWRVSGQLSSISSFTDVQTEDIVGMIPATFFEWLKRQKFILGAMVGVLQGYELHSLAEMDPKRLVCFLALFRSVTPYHVMSETLSKEAITEFLKLYRLPSPVGGEALRLIRLIDVELQSPGSRARRLFESENFEVELMVSGEYQTASLTKVAEYGRLVHVFCNPNCSAAQHLKDLINASNTNDSSPENNAKHMLKLIESMFSVSGIRFSKPFSERQKSQKLMDIANIYRRLSKAITISKEYGDDSPEREEKRASLIELAREINQKFFDEKLPETGEQNDECESIGTILRRSIPIGESSSLNFKSHLLDWEWQPQSQEVLDHGPSSVSPIASTLPLTSCSNILLQLLKDAISGAHTYAGRPRTDSTSSRPSPSLRIVIAGGNGSVHYFVNAWVRAILSLVSTKASISSIEKLGVAVQFFIVPCGKIGNTLSEYISVRDDWYKAMVAAPFRTNLPYIPMSDPGSLKTVHRKQSFGFVKSALTDRRGHKTPQRERAQTDANIRMNRKEALPGCIRTPIDILKSTISAYARYAEVTLPVHVFKCEAWSAHKKLATHTTIAFCTTAELGGPVELAVNDSRDRLVIGMGPQHHVTGQPMVLSGQSHLSSTQKDNFLSKYKLNANINMTQLDLLGEENATPTVLLNRAFSSVVITNVPRNGGNGYHNDPTREWLDVVLADAENVQKTRKRIRSIDDMEHMPSFLVRKIQIDAQNHQQPFHIRLDGEIHGPFYRVRISPYTIQSEKGPQSLTFPVAAFSL